MKKILMVCEAYGGGVFSYVTQLCNDMADEFEVWLAYSLRPQTPKNYKEFLDKRVHLIELKCFKSGSITSVKMDIRAVRELCYLQRRIQPDLIHLHSSIAGGIGRIAFHGKKYKIIYTPHGYAHILMGKGLKSLLFGTMEKILGRHRNCVTLTCCESEDEEARKLTRRSAYIETGLNLQELSAVLNSAKPVKHERFTVYTLGRICVQKQPALFNKIAQLVPEADFIWLGGGELADELTAPNIKITGWMSREQALEYAKDIEVFILCSLGEAIAMSLIENMYMKKLILVSNVMGNKSVIEDGNNGFVCETAEEYAVRIRDAIKEFPEHLAEKARQDVEVKYNSEIMKKRFIEFYNSL